MQGFFVSEMLQNELFKIFHKVRIYHIFSDISYPFARLN